MKPVSTIAVVLFGLIALLQLFRLILGWEVTVGGLTVPSWVSAIACVIAAAFAVMLWREARTGLGK